MTPLELTAEHHVRHWGPEHVARCVLSALERRRRLQVAVVDIHARVADRAAEVRIPGVIEKGDQAKIVERLAGDRRDCVAGLSLRAYVDRSVIEVILDAGAL